MERGRVWGSGNSGVETQFHRKKTGCAFLCMGLAFSPQIFLLFIYFKIYTLHPLSQTRQGNGVTTACRLWVPASLASVGSVGGWLVTSERLYIEAIAWRGASVCCVRASWRRTPYPCFPIKLPTSQPAAPGELRPREG